MRITVLSILCCMQLLFAGSAFAQSAKVTINKNDVAIKQVFSEIEKQTDYLFIYNTQAGVDKKVSVDVKDALVSAVLSDILKNTDMTYKLEGKHIVISKKDENQSASGQPMKIKGTVTDKTGKPIIGAGVVIKGTTTGVATDVKGNFTINAAKGQVLTLSYIGYAPKEVVVGNSSTLHITMDEGAIAMQGLVVTALGIKREAKALSYKVQQIQTDEITTVKDANFMNTLAGKVAGVTINTSSTGVGGATRVVMRGAKSITKDNNAMYVIDGIPVLNSNKGKLEQNDEYSIQPRSESPADINPEDIESLSILSGAAASALYGSEAANGVILITTKKGRAGKPQITLSNQTTFSNPLMMPEFQNQYGNTPGSYFSWGEKLDTPSSYNPKKFFNTGVNLQSSVSMSVGSERNQTYVSLANVDATGIMPNNKFERTNITMRNTTLFLDNKMTLDAGFSYIIHKDQNLTAQGQYFNPLVPLYTYPRGESFDDIRVYERYNEARKISEQHWKWGDMGMAMQNPYWVAHRNLQNNDRTRYMANLNLSYDVLDWLSITGRARIDRSSTEFTRRLYASTLSLFADSKGYYHAQNEVEAQTYGDVMVNINKTFGNFSLVSHLGASITDRKFSAVGFRGSLGQYPNMFSVLNIARNGRNSTPVQERWREQNQAVFASVEGGWKKMVYLTGTIRGEWPSQLANTEQSYYLFPSVGLSGLVHEMVQLPKVMSFMKIRASYTSVGSPIPRNISISGYEYKPSTGKFETSARMPAFNLKPERTNSWEIGLDTYFFNSKLQLEATVYRSVTKNQTLYSPLSATSQYSDIVIQPGRVVNKGLEGALRYNNKWGDFGWSASFTASYNKNKVEKITDRVYNKATDSYEFIQGYDAGGAGNLKFWIADGSTMGDLYATSEIKRDANGNIMVNPTTGEIYIETLDSENYKKLGSVLPDWNLGFSNGFSYKGLHLDFVLSARLGGIVVSPTQAIMDGFGVSKVSAEARNNGGVAVNRGFVDAEKWYRSIGLGGVYSYNTYNADNVRLQELSIGYDLPSKWFKDVVKIKVSLIGRNLWMIYNKAPFDPELTASTGTYYQGIDYFMQPSLRSLGFGVNIKF